MQYLPRSVSARGRSPLSNLSNLMLRSILIVAVTTLAGLFTLQSCKNDNVNAPSPESAITSLFDDNQSIDDNEIFDDAEDGARAAAIDTAVAVKWQIKVTSACSSTGSASFKYVEGTQTTPVLSSTATTTLLGFKSFSVPVAKFNTVVLKTFDKTKSYAIYAKVPGTARVPAVGTSGQPGYVAAIPAGKATYKYVTTLAANPAAEKKLNSAGTKRVGRPITTAIRTMGCPN
jgi:hypothetical protein